MKKYIIIITAILVLAFGGIYVYIINKSTSDDTEILKYKVDEEISYLSKSIISIMNKFNNINYANYKIIEESIVEKNDNKSDSTLDKNSQNSSSNNSEDNKNEQSNSINTTNINIEYSSILVSKTNNIEWDYIKKEVEKMYSTWTTILIDLNSLNVNKENLLKYTSTLDNITNALENKNKETALGEFASLYGLLALYIKDYSDDAVKINILETKSNILYAYALAEYNDKWSQVNEKLKMAQTSYINIVNNQYQDNSSSNSINKAYILLNEIQKNTDKKIFYINYKNLMQELDSIS